MKVAWSPLAIQRVTEIARFIALDKPGAARHWADSIFDAAGRLEVHPESGRIVPELGRPEIREVTPGGDRIIYRIEDGGAQSRSVWTRRRRRALPIGPIARGD